MTTCWKDFCSLTMVMPRHRQLLDTMEELWPLAPEGNLPEETVKMGHVLDALEDWVDECSTDPGDDGGLGLITEIEAAHLKHALARSLREQFHKR